MLALVRLQHFLPYLIDLPITTRTADSNPARHPAIRNLGRLRGKLETTGLLDMAISFSRLKKSALAPTDKIPYGKLKGCRVCDVASTHVSYLLWLHYNTATKLDQSRMSLVREAERKHDAKLHYEQEIAPYLDGYEDSVKPVYFVDGSGYLPASGPAGPLYFDHNGET